MTVTSWGDVPPGMPMHHHCVVSIESRSDPRYWVDASTETPALVAWQYPDAVAWVYEQLVEHRSSAVDDLGEYVAAQIAAYVPAQAGPDVEHFRGRGDATSYCPGLWERLPNTLQTGRWVMEFSQLGAGRKLVMQILGYADRGQPTGFGARPYAVCDRHSRPDDKPYLGLTSHQAEHMSQYDRLYVPS